MKKTISFFLFTLCFLPIVKPQSLPSAAAVLDSVNSRLAYLRQGFFDVESHYKSAAKDDTSRRQGRVYFFPPQNETDIDTFRSFVLYEQGQITEAFDGSTYYILNHPKQLIHTRSPAEYGGVLKLLGRTWRMYLVYKPFITIHKPAFDQSLFKNPSILLSEKNGGQTAYITNIDSSKNDMKISPNDPEMITYKMIYDIVLSDYSVKKRQEWVHFIHKPQYLEQHFSKITSLPDSVRFQHIFKLDSLLSAGYVLQKQSKQEVASPSVLPRKPIIQIGEQLPDFSLPDLDSNIVRLNDFTKGLLLIDFWYRSCYPCLKAMPVLEALHQKYRSDGLKVYGINPVDKKANQVKSFLREREVTYLSLMDPDKLYAEKVGLQGYPLALLVDLVSKKVLFVHRGYSDKMEAELTQVIEEYLKK